MLRSHNCNALRKEDSKKRVTLCGWIHRRRNLGSLVFVDLRDVYGKTQLLFDPQLQPQLEKALERLRLEWVISVEGTVEERKDANPDLATGEIEVVVDTLQILSEAKTPPFAVCANEAVQEDLRLKYRFLDIRKGFISNNLIMRHQAMQMIRQSLSSMGFFEISTPILGKPTPEGARDYLVPSRLHPQSFYALPQSPQLFKQILMLSGMDRYFQIASCFRDEDLRKDRQPEFTQIDIELSFCSQEAFFPMIESLMQGLFSKLMHKELTSCFPRMSYNECMELYGTDKPDIRFAMTFVEVTSFLRALNINFLEELFANNAIAKGFTIKNGAQASRKKLETYIRFVQDFGLSTLTWVKRKNGELTSNAKKLFSQESLEQLAQLLKIEEGGLALIGIAAKPVLHQALDHLRRKIGQEMSLCSPEELAFLWVTDFPLFTQDPNTQKITSAHHPFTSPNEQDLACIDKDPLQVRSIAYDLVLNGYEIGSGSQRIHNPKIQKKIFSILGLTEEEIEQKFGFFVNALEYGTPPHLGIALGLDRIMMILCKVDNIRDVIAFPKTQTASDLLLQAPSKADQTHLKELKIQELDIPYTS